MFQEWTMSTLESDEWKDVYEFWAKQSEKREAGLLNTGGISTCEGTVNTEIPEHGRAWT